jgi:hypothetical protein
VVGILLALLIAAGLLILFLVSSHGFGLAPIQLSDVPLMVVEQAPLRRGFRVQSYNVNRQVLREFASIDRLGNGAFWGHKLSLSELKPAAVTSAGLCFCCRLA